MRWEAEKPGEETGESEGATGVAVAFSSRRGTSGESSLPGKVPPWLLPPAGRRAESV